METLSLIIASSCVSIAAMFMFLLMVVVGYNAIMWFLLARKGPPPPPFVNQVAPQDLPAIPYVGERNPYYTPVIVIESGTAKGFYGVLKFVPPGHKETMSMRREYSRAVNGHADYLIITEQVALEQGRRFGGFVYLSELAVPKVV